MVLGLIIGAVIGLLSGLTGVGGGILLSPVLLLMRWAKIKDTFGVAIVFILVNSIAGLLGHISSVQSWRTISSIGCPPRWWVGGWGLSWECESCRSPISGDGCRRYWF